MGSAVTVKNYCERNCCPEESNLFESIIKDNSNYNQEKENHYNNKDNSNLDNKKKIARLFKVNDDENIINYSIIEKEESKEKDKLCSDNNNINNQNVTKIKKINFSLTDNNLHNNNSFNKIKQNNIIDDSFKQTELLNSNKKCNDFKANTEIKSNLKQKTKSIKINKKNKNSHEKKKKKNKNNSLTSGIKNSKIEKIENKVKFNIKKESEIKTNFEEENNQKNGGENGKSKNLLLVKQNENSIYDTAIFKNNSSNLLSFVFDTIEVSEESFRSVQLKSNKFQTEFPKFLVKRPLDNDFIKGNFLLKKIKFKYQGNKDSEGKKLGFGILLYEDSSKLMGNFFDSKLNGIVYFYNCGLDNSTYIGEYMNNIPDGYGIYSRQGLKIEGNNWKKNYINNIGIAILDEEEIYEGEFRDSLKEGIGTYRWEDGASYMGYFKDNQINGYGFMNFANGNSYVGEFIQGYLSGWGKFIWEDGKTYVGNYTENKKNGFGIFIWKYEPLIALIGFWEKGKQNGTFVKLANGDSKYYFYHNSKKIEEIGSQGDICRYLRPSQIKYKNFLKKSYHQLENFIKKTTEL